MAHGILVPRPGIKPTSPALEGGFLTLGPPGKSLEFISLKNTFQMKIELFDILKDECIILCINLKKVK